MMPGRSYPMDRGYPTSTSKAGLGSTACKPADGSCRGYVISLRTLLRAIAIQISVTNTALPGGRNHTVRKNRFLSRLWSRALVVIIAAGGALLTEGVSADATPSVSAPQAMATGTSTELTTCPDSPVPYGTRVTLTAKVTPATATGTVKFTDGITTDLGTVPISGNGTASVSTEVLTIGTHSLTAMFTPNTTSFTGPSSTVSLTVTGIEGSRSLQMAVPQAQPSGQSLDGQRLPEIRVPAVDRRPLLDVEDGRFGTGKGWLVRCSTLCSEGGQRMANHRAAE